MALMRPDTESVDSRFLLYAFLGPYFQEVLRSRTVHGSTVDRIPLIEFSAFPIQVPSLSEQRAIAHILGTLDDKIELNRKMNATLDEIARTLFTSWFVNFDPVRAKAEGRQPEGMDAETAALFPDRFVNSELGPSPEGWGVMALDEFGEVLGGGTPKTSEPVYWNGEIPWFSMADLPNPSDVFVIRTKKNITKAGEANSSAKILPANTTILTARGTVGQVAMAGVPMAINQSCYGLFPKDGTSTSAMYYWTKSSVSLLEQRAHGSVFSTITRSTLSGIKTAVPPQELLKAFEALSSPILARIRINLLENSTLGETRDILLPELLSGRLCVPNAGRLEGASMGPNPTKR
jgi:type I restriction enzyme S subunit